MQEYEELYKVALEINTTRHSVDTESAVAGAYQLKRLIENPCGKRGATSWRLMQKQYDRMIAGKDDFNVTAINTRIISACKDAQENALKLAKRIYAEEIYAKSGIEEVDAQVLTIKLYAAVEAFTNAVRDQIYKIEISSVRTSGGNIRNSLARLRVKFEDYPELDQKIAYINKYMLPSEEQELDSEMLAGTQLTENQINSTLQYQNRRNKICEEGRKILRMLLLQMETAEIVDCGVLLDNALYYLQGRLNQLDYLKRLLSDCMDGDLQLQDIEYPEMIYYGVEVARKIEPLSGKPTEIADICPSDAKVIAKGKHIERDLISGRTHAFDPYYEDKNTVITYHQQLYREGIGIDYTQLSFDVTFVDVDKLEKAITDYAKPSGQEIAIKPWIECITSNDKNFFPIFSEVKRMDAEFIREYSWKQVKIQLSPYTILYFKQNNTKKKENDVENQRPTDYLMEIKVIPRIGMLGNWENYTVDEYEKRVKEAITQVGDIFGIYINAESVVFQTIEINNTFAFGHTMNELIRPLKYYQLYLENFGNASYEVGRDGNKLVAAAPGNVSTSEMNHRNRKGMTVTGLFSQLKGSKNIEIKIYDKAIETQETFHVHSERSVMDIVEPEGGGCYVRVEFRLRKEQKIHEHFKEGIITDDPEKMKKHKYHACPMEITQDDLIRIYQHMIERYFEKPFEKYCEESISKIQGLIESVDMQEKGWRNKFIKKVGNEEILMRSTPMILQASDIDDAIKRSKYSRRASRVIPIFHKLLEDPTEYSLGSEKSYEMLSQFIYTAKMEEGISMEREVSYYIKTKWDDEE